MKNKATKYSFAALNGNIAKDIVYKGTPFEKKFETVKFKKSKKNEEY